MAERNKLRSDGQVVDLELQEANQSEVVLKAKRVTQVDSFGNIISASDEDVQRNILIQLEILNKHMSLVTNEIISKEDIK